MSKLGDNKVLLSRYQKTGENRSMAAAIVY
jgi:hypothetical protein